MAKLRKAIYIILYVIAVMVITGAVLSMLKNTDSRFLKMLDFPRLQFFITSLITLVLFTIVTRGWRWHDYLLVAGLLTALAINGSYLINYTGLVSEEVPTASGTYSPDDRLGILLVNVKMSNRKAQPLINLIQEKKPDLILAMEIDKWWDKKLKPIEKDYSYSQEAINEVAYGMSLYSMHPIREMSINNLQNEKVPSFETTITLANGKNLSFHAVHPVPPTFYKNLPDNAGQQEIAMQKLGEKIQSRKLPTIVAGDINDVVWSYTDELTGTENTLFDVRVGRGFFSSYDANSYFMRWPLDHVFVTEEFELLNLERLSSIGSDHFPIYVELVLK